MSTPSKKLSEDLKPDSADTQFMTLSSVRCGVQESKQDRNISNECFSPRGRNASEHRTGADFAEDSEIVEKVHCLGWVAVYPD